MVCYMVVCFIFWEAVRIFLFHTFQALIKKQIQQFAHNLVAAAHEGFVQAKPQMERLQESVTQLAVKARDSITKLVNSTSSAYGQQQPPVTSQQHDKGQ